jgi:hypothetical protein
MITLFGGPAAGTYVVKRAPIYLRAVVDSVSGEKDVLNELEDEPSANETVSVYKREGEASTVHLLMSPRKLSGFYALAKYKHLTDVDGESLRETVVWQAWVADQVGQPIDFQTGVILDETAADEKRIRPRRTDTDDAGLKGE